MRKVLSILCTAQLLGWSTGFAEYERAPERAASGNWERTDVGHRPGKCWVQEIMIGAGRNDGINRLYAASPGTGSVDEYTWDGSEWQRVVLGTPEEEPRGVCLGEGRNDGRVSLYAADETETLNEYTWNGSAWGKATVCSESHAAGLAVGRLGADDNIRIYTSKKKILGRPTSTIFAIIRDGASWHREPFDVGANNANSLKLGDGRNDGITRLYVANHDRHVYEVTLDGTAKITDLGHCGSVVTDVAVGPGRGDGVNRVYGACWDGSLHEFSWNGESWENSAVLKPKRSKFLRNVEIGAARGDGVNRVYCAGDGSGVVEFTWMGSKWSQSRIEKKEVDGLAIGDARNDGVLRLYAGSGEYEFIPDKSEDQ